MVTYIVVVTESQSFCGPESAEIQYYSSMIVRVNWTLALITMKQHGVAKQFFNAGFM